jgi:arsenate reductase-like glutaredoxin family protein
MKNVHNILNSPITEEEILRVVKFFKSNKASGYDDIVNEHDYGKGLNNLDLAFLNPKDSSYLYLLPSLLVNFLANYLELCIHANSTDELPENEKDQEIHFDSVDRENVHNILNSPITEEEILRVVKNYSHNLSFRTEVNVLLRHATNVIIGLYELGSLVSPLFL